MLRPFTAIALLLALTFSALAEDCYVTEFRDLALVPTDGAQIAVEPRLADQKITLGAATASAAFNNNSRIIRVHCTAGCSVNFGTAPVATTSMLRIPSGGVEYFGVPAASSYKLSVVSNP